MGANITGVWLPWDRRGSFPPFLVLYPSVQQKGSRARLPCHRVSKFVLLDRPKSHEISMCFPYQATCWLELLATGFGGGGGGSRCKSRRDNKSSELIVSKCFSQFFFSPPHSLFFVNETRIKTRVRRKIDRRLQVEVERKGISICVTKDRSKLR